MKIIFSSRCLEYEMPGHPESPRRVGATHEYLLEKGFEFIEPGPCQDNDILCVHTHELLEKVKRESFYDPDTPVLPGIYDYARLSAGAAIMGQKLALKGEVAFSLMRPPGHHATKENLGGFCYFNNIAMATKLALESIGKVAILDIDCHHGNGTQDIFLGEERVLYVSLHQSPLYPGTGQEAIENCLNYPLAPGVREEEYLGVFKEVLERVGEFDPDLVAVSAGFDTYRFDPLTQIDLEEESYRIIGKLIAGLNKPTFTILEGGYSRKLPECIAQFLSGYGGE